MKAIQWPWSKKKKIEETEVKETSNINLRNPNQKLPVVDPLGNAMLDVAKNGVNENIEDCPSIFLVCDCGKTHFRHTGYMETIVPYVAADGGKLAQDSHPVKTCCSCRKSYVNIGPKVYNVTEQIDIKAWEKFEKEAHKATGPGGEC